MALTKLQFVLIFTVFTVAVITTGKADVINKREKRDGMDETATSTLPSKQAERSTKQDGGGMAETAKLPFPSEQVKDRSAKQDGVGGGMAEIVKLSMPNHSKSSQRHGGIPDGFEPLPLSNDTKEKMGKTTKSGRAMQVVVKATHAEPSDATGGVPLSGLNLTFIVIITAFLIIGGIAAIIYALRH